MEGIDGKGRRDARSLGADQERRSCRDSCAAIRGHIGQRCRPTRERRPTLPN